MQVTKTDVQFDVTHLAELARLELSDDERARYEGELTEILGYIDQIQKLELGDVPEMAQVTGLTNVFQEEDGLEDLSQEALITRRTELLGDAVGTDGFVKIPAVFGVEHE